MRSFADHHPIAHDAVSGAVGRVRSARSRVPFVRVPGGEVCLAVQGLVAPAVSAWTGHGMQTDADGKGIDRRPPAP